MDSSTNLCHYCSHIEFERLRNPTVAELCLLNTKKDYHEDKYPYKNQDSLEWSLGLQSRIDESSATCPFCHAVTRLLLQNHHILTSLHADGLPDPHCIAKIQPCALIYPPKNTSWKINKSAFWLHRITLRWRPLDPETLGTPGPGLIDRPKDAWKELAGSFQTYHRQTTIAQTENPFSHNREAPDHILFSGRKRPALLNTNICKNWLLDCLTNHKNGCGSVHQSGRVHHLG